LPLLGGDFTLHCVIQRRAPVQRQPRRHRDKPAAGVAARHTHKLKEVEAHQPAPRRHARVCIQVLRLQRKRDARGQEQLGHVAGPQHAVAVCGVQQPERAVVQRALLCGADAGGSHQRGGAADGRARGGGAWQRGQRLDDGGALLLQRARPGVWGGSEFGFRAGGASCDTDARVFFYLPFAFW
jgi:hypothetical protein